LEMGTPACSKNSVSMEPGKMQVTLMPSLRNSLNSDSE
jgi:hypothetical protein